MNINILTLRCCFSAPKSLDKSTWNPCHYLCSKPLKLMQITCAKKVNQGNLEVNSYETNRKCSMEEKKKSLRFYSMQLQILLVEELNDYQHNKNFKFISNSIMIGIFFSFVRKCIFTLALCWTLFKYFHIVFIPTFNRVSRNKSISPLTLLPCVHLRTQFGAHTAKRIANKQKECGKKEKKR